MSRRENKPVVVYSSRTIFIRIGLERRSRALQDKYASYVLSRARSHLPTHAYDEHACVRCDTRLIINICTHAHSRRTRAVSGPRAPSFVKTSFIRRRVCVFYPVCLQGVSLIFSQFTLKIYLYIYICNLRMNHHFDNIRYRNTFIGITGCTIEA